MPIYINTNEDLIEILNRVGIVIEPRDFWNRNKTHATRVSNSLGYSNGWETTPDVVKKCRCKEATTVTIGRCLTETKCFICDYSYKTDSGD